MSRAESARRERPSRRLSLRPRRPAGPATPLLASFARRFGLPAGLLAGLVLVCAGLFPAPALAQTETVVWTATMTVGEPSGATRGYAASSGSLTDADGNDHRSFTYPAGSTNTYTVLELTREAPASAIEGFSFVPNILFTAAQVIEDGLVLEVAGVRLPLKDSTVPSGYVVHHWSPFWLDDNASSLDDDTYTTTLPAGGEVTVRLLAAGTTNTAPGKPTGLTATANGSTQIDLDWTAPSDNGGANITGYRIEVSTDDSSWSNLKANTGDALTTYSHTGLSGGSTRYYRVSAINSVGTGDPSDSANATTTTGGSCEPDLSGRTEVWTADLGVGEDPNAANWYGYNTGTNAAGTLSDDKFTIDPSTTEYTVTDLFESTTVGFRNSLTFVVNTAIPQAEIDKLRLHVCGDTFDLSDATSHDNKEYVFGSAHLDWSAATTVKVALSQTGGNSDPTLANAIPDQTATAGTAFSYTFPANTFNDADTGDTLTYTATLSNGDALPAWLTFVSGTRTFSGTGMPPAVPTAVETLTVKVTADDGNGGTAATDEFDIAVGPPAKPSNCGTDDIWCATLVVGMQRIGGTEYNGYTDSSSMGALSENGDAFTYTEGGTDTTHTVEGVLLFGADKDLRLVLDPDGRNLDGDGLALLVDGTRLELDDAQISSAWTRARSTRGGSVRGRRATTR